MGIVANGADKEGLDGQEAWVENLTVSFDAH